jgi:hypothetical protein
MSVSEGCVDKGRIIEIISYLIASANILPNEPTVYGPMRLLEGAKRLIDYLEEKGLADDELIGLRDMIVKSMNLVLTDEEAFRKATAEVVKSLARYLKTHY